MGDWLNVRCVTVCSGRTQIHTSLTHTSEQCILRAESSLMMLPLQQSVSALISVLIDPHIYLHSTA
jgi:hypothetical protein